jgi:hypothetical protein
VNSTVLVGLVTLDSQIEVMGSPLMVSPSPDTRHTEEGWMCLECWLEAAVKRIFFQMLVSKWSSSLALS